MSETIENFTHLHVHTIYSLLDGACKLKPLVSKAKNLGMTSLAITDHGHCGGTLAFQRECAEQGIKSLIGMEGYITHDINVAKLDAEHRHALATLTALRDNSSETFCWLIEKKKSDNKEVHEYYNMLKDNPEDEDSVLDLDKLSLDNFIDRWSMSRILSFRKVNLELIDQYEYDTKQYHLILLAMNTKGWQNLISIQSIASQECTYNGRFLADFELIKKYSEGIIVTSACIGNLIAHYVIENELELAEQEILKYKSVFGDRFYLEIQPLSLDRQVAVNKFYMDMCKKHEIEPVATSDVHYIDKEDWDDHDTYMCIALGRLKDEKVDREVYLKTHKSDPEGLKYKERMKYTNDFWLRSKDEMVESFETQQSNFKELDTKEYTEFWNKALANTNVIADRIEDNILIGSKEPLYPEVKNAPKNMTHDEWLFSQAYDGLIKYAEKMKSKGEPIDFNTYLNRLFDEFAVISSKHYTDYFLGVQEYVNWGDSINPDTGYPNAMSGPGRGSGAASLILMCLGITKNVDPIKYDLMFSRFLTMDRTDVPDVDTDFTKADRHKLIDHIKETYGFDKTCHIGNWTVMKAYTTIKDFARVLNMPPSESDKINKELQKLIEEGTPKFKDFDALETEDPSKYKKFVEIETEYKELFRLARKFEGSIRQYGAHASGIIACPKELLGLIPTRFDPKTGVTVALYDGKELESIGLIKYD